MRCGAGVRSPRARASASGPRGGGAGRASKRRRWGATKQNVTPAALTAFDMSFYSALLAQVRRGKTLLERVEASFKAANSHYKAIPCPGHTVSALHAGPPLRATGRDARSRAPVPQDHRLRRSRQPRARGQAERRSYQPLPPPAPASREEAQALPRDRQVGVVVKFRGDRDLLDSDAPQVPSRGSPPGDRVKT